MKSISESTISMRYLKSQKRRTVLLVAGVILSVALVTALFTVFNALQQFEVIAESVTGAWQVSAYECTPQQADALSKRLDVTNSGREVNAADVTLGSQGGKLTGYDKSGAELKGYFLQQGRMPQKEDEIALEQWSANKIVGSAKIGSKIPVKINEGQTKEYTLVGIFKDNIEYKAGMYYQGAISIAEAQRIAGSKTSTVYMQVRDNVGIKSFIDAIKKDQGIGEVGQHNGLLVAQGRSDSGGAEILYLISGALALLVIFSAVVMIYNAFNISVNQRVRQFGLLRALGASPSQMKKIVRREALLLSAIGVIPGLICGVAASTILIAILKSLVPMYFISAGPTFVLSWPSLLIGAITGFLTTWLSAFIPSRRASKISPVEAISQTPGKSGKVHKKRMRGIATRLLPVEAALSFRQLMSRKRSFALTALSLSFGMLLLLCFGAYVDMLRYGVARDDYYGDVLVYPQEGKDAFTGDIVKELSNIKGIEHVTPMSLDKVTASFKYDLLGSDYKAAVKNKSTLVVTPDSSGYVGSDNKSILIGMNFNDLQQFSQKEIFGSINESELNQGGVLLMLNNPNHHYLILSDLRPGEMIRVQTPSGSKELKICGIIVNNPLPYLSGEDASIGLFTTKQTFSSISSIQPNAIKTILKSGTDNDSIVNSIKDLAAQNGGQSMDMRDNRKMSNQFLLVAYIFIYGFISIIALIGILNIVNTMSTNIYVRRRELALLRAGGMTMHQVNLMIAIESLLYGLLALIIGLGAGIPLHKLFYEQTVKLNFGIPWGLPWFFIIISAVVTIIACLLSIIMPLRQTKRMIITESIANER